MGIIWIPGQWLAFIIDKECIYIYRTILAAAGPDITISSPASHFPGAINDGIFSRSKCSESNWISFTSGNVLDVYCALEPTAPLKKYPVTGFQRKNYGIQLINARPCLGFTGSFITIIPCIREVVISGLDCINIENNPYDNGKLFHRVMVHLLSVLFYTQKVRHRQFDVKIQPLKILKYLYLGFLLLESLIPFSKLISKRWLKRPRGQKYW